MAAGGAPQPDDQRETIAFLSRPSSYGAGVERVEIVETHVSMVFLAGDRAYKLKKPKDFGFFDYSTPALRRLIHHDADDAAIREQAYKDGMKPLRVSGAAKVDAGVTTAEEVVKVAPLA